MSAFDFALGCALARDRSMLRAFREKSRGSMSMSVRVEQRDII